MRKVQTEGTNNEWWCPGLEQLRRKIRKTFNKAKRTKLKEDWLTYQINLREFKKVCRQQQRKAWRAYCEAVEDYSQASRLQKALSNDKQRSVGILRREDSSKASNLQESAEILMDTHFPGSVPLSTTNWTDVPIRPSRHDWQTAGSVIDEDKIRWAISGFSPFKSPGPDGVRPALLQWGLVALMPHLVGMFRASIALRYVPSKWREVRVVFIPKPGKMDYSLPKSFRPISLTSFFLKTMERRCE